MAELHAIGQIVGASGFGSANLYCKWGAVAGSAWRVLEGATQGQTQLDLPADSSCTVWGHPIDIHYASRGLHGWPKLHFEVWSVGAFGRHDLAGYGFVYIPTSPGIFELECVTWRPQGTAREELAAIFFGGHPRLRNTDLVVSGAERCRLRTCATGKVHVTLAVLLKDFEQYGVVTGAGEEDRSVRNE